jgi:molybdopterin molybdotransferase
VAQLIDDCFAAGGPLMTIEQALALIMPQLVAVVGTENVALSDALGRVLAEPLVAAISVPEGDNSAVDGYAVYFDDLDPTAETRLRVVGRAAAGHPFAGTPERGTALRIFTGAPMPPGPDTVMMQEDCTVEGDRVVIRAGIKRGSNRRKAGEDVKAGSTILAAGIRLRPQDIGLAAAIGCTSLAVTTSLRVALFSSGDELIEPGQPLPAGAIYDSNRFTLAALLRRMGIAVSDLGILSDRREVVQQALADAARGHDAIVTSGGVSVGEEDHMKAAVEALGRLHAWRLAIKPGRPIALGQIATPGFPAARQVPFLGLPGNPVAAMVTFLRVLRPILQRLMGESETPPRLYRVRADFEHRKKKDRREFLRARLSRDSDGNLVARKFPREGAGILSSLVEADGLVELPEALTRLEPGSMVEFLPFSEVGL